MIKFTVTTHYESLVVGEIDKLYPIIGLAWVLSEMLETPLISHEGQKKGYREQVSYAIDDATGNILEKSIVTETKSEKKIPEDNPALNAYIKG